MTIYWVGTGPGDPGLMTVKGLALVQEADAIVGDVLDNARLLQQTRPDAEIHDVGCRAARNKMPQEQINQLLVDLGQQGKTVVRLWQGDPFVFGRAAQEMVFAQESGLRVGLVPGVTSAIAAPAYAGVPVTHWEYTTSFAVVSGFESKNINVRANWDALAKIETLVILMPLESLPEIVDRLLAAGRHADTPVLAVHAGSRPHQKQVVASLGTLVEVVETNVIEHPAIILVGNVAELAGQLNWYQPDDYPLLGKRVLVTRPIHQAANFMADLRALGAEPIPFPTIKIEPVENNDPLDEAIQKLSAAQPGETDRIYDWLVLTSANGVTAFWNRLDALGLDSRCLASVKIVAIGPATAAELHRRSIVPDLVPDVYTAEGVLDAFDQLGSVSGQRFLLARADIARKTLAEGLVARGALVDEIPAYRTVPVENGSPPPPADIVTFTSSSTVQGYVNCLREQLPAEALKNSQVVCIGPITAATAEELQVPITAVAKKYTIDGILETLKGGQDDNGKTANST